MKKIPCDIYSRVVGYFQPVRSWNPGKQAEFADRKYFDKSLKSGEVNEKAAGKQEK